MKSARNLFGPMTALATIRPPGRSYADVRRFLEDCRKAGVAAVIESKDGQPTAEFATPLGPALLRLWRWVEDSERMGIPYEAAEASFNAAIERDRDAFTTSMLEQQRTSARARHERDNKNGKRRSDPDADALLAYAEETIR